MKFLNIIVKHWAWVLLCVVAGILLFWSLRPTPIPVDTYSLARAPMIMTIDDSGTTNVKNLYRVSTPVAGTLERTIIQAGDSVTKDETVIATLHSTEAPFIDARSRSELLATRSAAQAGIKLARSEKEKLEAALTKAKSDYQRATRMIVSDVISQSEMEQFTNTYRAAQANAKSGAAQVEVQLAELARIDAMLAYPDNSEEDQCCLDILAPATGKVLTIQERSERSLPAGSIVAEIGNTSDMNIIAELTTQDTVKIRPDMPVAITNWGGDSTLDGWIERIEPAAVSKISALGIEEQRVKVTIGLKDIPKELGHGFHVDIAIQTWQGEDILQVPIGALFRFHGEWAVFSVNEEKTAELKLIELGKMNRKNAEVITGLEEGESVILYPSDKIDSGSLVDLKL